MVNALTKESKKFLPSKRVHAIGCKRAEVQFHRSSLLSSGAEIFSRCQRVNSVMGFESVGSNVLSLELKNGWYRGEFLASSCCDFRHIKDGAYFILTLIFLWRN